MAIEQEYSLPIEPERERDRERENLFLEKMNEAKDASHVVSS